jgi:hypothetical protein
MQTIQGWVFVALGWRRITSVESPPVPLGPLKIRRTLSAERDGPGTAGGQAHVLDLSQLAAAHLVLVEIPEIQQQGFRIQGLILVLTSTSIQDLGCTVESGHVTCCTHIWNLWAPSHASKVP